MTTAVNPAPPPASPTRVSQITVRSARPEDRAAIYDVLMTSGVFGRTDAECVDEMFTGTWTALQANADADTYHWLIAEAAGDAAGLTPVGFACYGTESLTHGTWDLFWVCVRPEARGMGAGRALLQNSVAGATAKGARMMVIYTSSTPPYASARAVYEACGFSRAAVVSNYYDDGDDLHIYTRRLAEEVAGC